MQGENGETTVWDRINEIGTTSEGSRKTHVSSYEYEGPEDLPLNERANLLRPCLYDAGKAAREWTKDDGTMFRSYVFAHTACEAASYVCANLVHWWYIRHGGEPATSDVHEMQNRDL